MDKKEQARKLRAQGWKYADIASELGVSISTAHLYVTGKKYKTIRYVRRSCNKYHISGIKCERASGHRGLHLASSKKGLINWK